ncbi:MAG: FtsX-like permease family protein [Clostridia bacterium]|nr:FtsX-like permease family protein [Clostridia bacterium]
MKKALVKDTIKEIKNTYKRFLSILLMAFLGVGFFAGIRACSPDMIHTIDQYFKENHVFDIEVISTLGLTNSDVEAIKKVENVDKVYGTYSKDGIVTLNENELVTKVLCVDDINKPILKKGRLPKNQNECVVEAILFEYSNMNIGDRIKIDIEKVNNDNGKEVPYLKQNELEIVGVVDSPLYISRERGASKLGSGKVNLFLYVTKDNINLTDIYTEIYVTMKNSKEYITSTKQYEDNVDSIKNDIEKIKEDRQKARYEELVESATITLEDAKIKLNNEKTEATEKIAQAEQEMENGKKEIETSENIININKRKADNEFASADAKIAKAKQQIVSGENELKTQETMTNQKIFEAEKTRDIYKSNLNNINNALILINSNYNDVIEVLKNPNLSLEQKEKLEKTKTELEKKKQETESTKNQLEDAIYKIEDGIKIARQELENARIVIASSKTELEQQEKSLQATKNTTYAKIEEARQELNKAKEELTSGKTELEEQKLEVNEKIIEAEGKLIEAEEKIADIEEPSWYILDRNTNPGYVSFIQDTKSIENIGAVFPVVFFVIATLISLTSMTSMVEEERIQIGTLKALGYNKRQIASKYLIYASLACIIGGILGMTLGFLLLPKIIWMMYKMMYTMPNIAISFNFEYGSIGLIVASVCIIGATLYAAMKELIHTPAVLMRPKAPKNGKRVFLERITFIWKHLKFSSKVTIRNIFRYKKRFLMTIIGIFGCTSLIIVGFGIKDSISSILPNQYEKVFNYDMQINLKNSLNNERKDDLVNKLMANDKIKETIEIKSTSATAINGDKTQDIQIIVPKNNEDLGKMIHIADVKSHEVLELKDDEIFITDKVAQLLNVKNGDTIKIENSDKEEKELVIANVIENYVGHYVYMSKSLYEATQEPYDTNLLYVKNNEISEEQEENLSKEMIGMSEVSSITLTSTVMNMMDGTLNSLNYVVVILIVSAGILAFVVLYNLSNVNISERIRELATIKVLGFYDNEVYKYISRETVLLTAIGIVLGIFGGYLLNSFIISTCEINSLRFAKMIEPLSYVYSILITIGFTLIVNIVTYFSLKKINMIESLKSVE